MNTTTDSWSRWRYLQRVNGRQRPRPACDRLWAAVRGDGGMGRVQTDTPAPQSAVWGLCAAGTKIARKPKWAGEPRGRKQCRIKSGGRKASPARLTPPRNAGRGTVLRGSLFRGWDHTGGHHGWNGPSLRRLSGIITGIWTEKEAQKQSMGGIQL